MVRRTEAGGYQLWLVDGWDHEKDEPLGGGEFLDNFETQEGAMREFDRLSSGRETLLRRCGGFPHLAILDRHGRLKYGPTLPRRHVCEVCRCRYAA